MIRRIKQLLFPDLKFKLHRFGGKLEKLGSMYGGWSIPTDLITKNSICYLAGAGEDISFDVLLAKRFKCEVFIFDPTPRSRIHFEKLIEASKGGTAMPVNNNPGEVYDLDSELINHLHFNEIGIWTKDDVLKFFAPKNDEHISHSILNLQETSNYFEATVKSLPNIMQLLNHSHIDLLKLDVEGVEFDVIDSFLEKGIEFTILCVEFHTSKESGFAQIQSSLDKLAQNGYLAVAREDLDFTFINKKSWR